MMQTKECKECKVEKALNAFDSHKGFIDGLKQKCRECIEKKKAERISQKAQTTKKCSVCRCLKNPDQFSNNIENKLVCNTCNDKRDAAALISEKQCTKCHQVRLISDFPIDKSYSSGVKARCKICTEEDKKVSLEKNKNKLRLPPPEIKEKTCSDCKAIKAIELFDKDKSYNSGYKAYCSDCRRKRSKSSQDKRINKYHEDAAQKMHCILRTRIQTALTKIKTKKDFPTMQLTGCDIKQLCNHIQSQFVEGMTWQNHGKGKDKWNLDHILPCRMFKLTDPHEQKRCFHFTNLQPLWEVDNAAKSGKVVLEDDILSSLYKLFDPCLGMW